MGEISNCSASRPNRPLGYMPGPRGLNEEYAHYRTVARIPPKDLAAACRQITDSADTVIVGICLIGIGR